MLLLCNYYVTYRCNASCEFCHFADHDTFNKFPNATLEDFKSNLLQLKELGVKFIDLTGGEPLLNKNLPEMLQFAKKLKMKTSVTTNTLLYPKYAEKLKGLIDLFHFSLDSPYEDDHNKIRRVDCYKSVFKSIEIAKSLNEAPDILFTVTNDTYKYLPEMQKIALEYDLILIVNPVFSYFGNPGLSDEAIEYIEDFCKGKKNVYINPSFLKLRKNGGNDINNPSCKAVSRVIVISPDNKIILPCYHFKNKEIPIDRPIKDIMQLDEYKFFLKNEGKFKFCQGCTVNCYFEPSFALPTNFYSFLSIASKIKYGYYKIIKQRKFL
ncbi:MAG TPA: radical SAM protein [Ignavibacteriales bacterium]|nr:radical SAM protein [Ignavibacteriales bacterium]HOL81574.1 radical SAM protein [Ignavibacteriales bacterium]HOM65596.1 radical SAM protein [Ignavibacteriales bacterium]HPD67804.1 radical SAM protein [Ignavibacteriales bacterium]HPP33688.1 radical SAM protein [Ignavibacteriales bacterium]